MSELGQAKIDVVEIEINEEERIVNIIATPYKEYSGDQLKTGERHPVWKSVSIMQIEKKGSKVAYALEERVEQPRIFEIEGQGE